MPSSVGPQGQIVEGDHQALERLQKFLDRSRERETDEGWSSDLLNDGLKIISASSSPVGKTTFIFKVGNQHVNRMGNLHGGCIATLFDWCTTTALIPVSRPGHWQWLGVSRTLNITYLRPVPLGEEIAIESEVVHAGKRLATLKGIIKRTSDGAIMATCEHGKVNTDPDVNEKL